MFDKANLIASSHNSLKEIKTENLSQPECPIIHALHAGGGGGEPPSNLHGKKLNKNMLN